MSGSPPTTTLAGRVSSGGRDLLTGRVLLLAVALTPATLAGAWVGKKITARISDRLFITLVEASLTAAGLVFLLGL